MAAKQLSDGNPEGTTLGQSASDLVSFWGADPVAQQASITFTSGTLGTVGDTVQSILTVLRNIGVLPPV